MALTKIFKKTSVPDELPDLAIDELKKDLKKDYSEKEEKPQDKKEESPKVEDSTKKGEENSKTEENAPKSEESPKVEEKKDNEEKAKESPPVEVAKEKYKSPEKRLEEVKTNLEKSFFNPLLEELKKENFDASKINKWYQQRFSEKGAIDEMKEYWEKQKDDFITETVEKEFKGRINEKMNTLQKLESEWQGIYINLIQKEEEMKKEEKEIKKIIKDFSEVLRKKANLKKEPGTK